MSDNYAKSARHFIQEIIEADLAGGKWGGRVATRFPPEPNGWLHIGHAKSICLNFGLAEQYGGTCNLRFDDTNPVKEEQEYVDSIIDAVRWLGFRWPGARDDDPQAGVLYASDYFQQMHDWAIELIRKGLAYVDDQNAGQIRLSRGTLTRPGTNSPFRDRGAEENLDLFERMRRGEVPDGAKVLRAKIDMAHPNLNMRDPVMYRILHAAHHRQGGKWCVYPMYDWAHGFEDSIEGVTHSICTLEFENHRPLYDWFIDAVNKDRTDDGGGPWGKPIHHPQQIEFARLELTYTLMSKRRLLELVKGGHVRGWDDPRMPTLMGLRRRGYTPEAIRAFCADVGVAKFNSVIDIVRLENAIRDDLNRTAERRMAVLRPLRVVITNWGEGTGGPRDVDWLDAVNNPEDPAAGTRKVPFSRVIYIEQDDFREVPPPKFFRLSPGKEVRLRYAYFITCREVVKDPSTGEIVELRCTCDPATRGGDAPDGRKVKATVHWVSAEHAIPAEVRLYEHLFTKPDPTDVRAAESDERTKRRGDGEKARRDGETESRRAVEEEGGDADEAGPAGAATGSAASPGGRNADWLANLNPNSLEVIDRAWVEPSLADAPIGARFQFERLGYFCLDPDSAAPSASAAGDPPAGRNAAAHRKLVFNRTVTLKDTWAKLEKKS
ncbi:MAG TPA: glutamine--tRNA ligase/YqeY domain fusion protein [Phycisphaerae bacterium]|nr:glutamine--tRNA ligase/YqeY domain fusion protein [Phycisphaerae bacterium]